MRQTIVYLKRDQMEVYRVENGEKTVKAETEWSEDNLVDKLKLIKDKFETKSVRVLVAREIAGTEMVLDVLAEAATEAKVSVEIVQPESLTEVEEDAVLALAAREASEIQPEVKMATEVVEERGNMQIDEHKPLVSVGRRVSGQRMRVVWIGLGLVLLLGIVVGGVWRARSAKQDSNGPDLVITPQATPTPLPSPVAVELAELSVQILNGSGVVGEAGRVETVLGKGGFDTEKIETANAKSYDYEDTEVRVKKGLPITVYEAVRDLLEDDYIVEVGTEVAESSEYDVIITVGTREGAVQGATTTASATPKPALKPSPTASASATPSASPTATSSAETEE